MAIDAKLIQQNLLSSLQNITPAEDINRGLLASQQREQGAIQNQLLQQRFDQGQAQAPLEQQALQQGVDLKSIQIQQQQAALDALGVPDIPTAKQLAFNAAKLSAIPTLEGKLNQIRVMKQTAVSQGRTTDNLDELEKSYALSEEAGDIELQSGIQAFQQIGLLTPQEEIRAKSEAAQAKVSEAGRKQRDADLKASLKADQTNFDRSSKLRGELSKASDEFNKINSAFGRIEASIVDPSPAGDLALIFNFMKMLDPGSTVREGEFATAEQATGVPTRITNQYNKLITGEKLAPKQRDDFVNQAKNLFKRSKSDNKKDIERIVSIGKQFGVSRENILGVQPEQTATTVQATRIRFDAQGNIIQ